MKKKFNSLIIIRKSSIEIDWILPVLNSMKNDVNFYTLFTNENSFKSLKSSLFLFNSWKKINKGFYVQKKNDKFFFKFLRKFIFYFNKISSIKKLVKFQNFLESKIHNISYLKKKINLEENQKFHFILNEFQKTSHWANIIIKNDSKSKLFLFPHSTHIFKYDGKKLKDIQKNNTKKNCDALFLGSTLDKDIWKNKVEYSKIYITGHPKYDFNWQQKFHEKINDKRIRIVFVIKNISDDSSKRLTIKYLETLCSICSRNNYLLVIKPPPTLQEEVKNILNQLKKNFSNKEFIINKKNIFTTLNKASVLINFNFSATSLDALSNSIPVIQLPAISKTKNKFGNNDSIYTKFNLVNKVSNINKLEINIKKLVKKKFKNKNFLTYFPNSKNSSKMISKIILKELKFNK